MIIIPNQKSENTKIQSKINYITVHFIDIYYIYIYYIFVKDINHVNFFIGQKALFTHTPWFTGRALTGTVVDPAPSTHSQHYSLQPAFPSY